MKIEHVTDFTRCLAVRAEVFIAEQGISQADEVDGEDPDCLHWLGIDDVGPVATLRVRVMGTKAKIQRVAVLRRARGAGLGAQLMTHVMGDLAKQGFTECVLGSQIDAIRFYETLGFLAYGDIYDDAGIPHRDMSRSL